MSISVAFAPFRDKYNPYLSVLKTNLEKCGVALVPAELNKQWLERHIRAVQIIHFHWPSWTYSSLGQYPSPEVLCRWKENVDYAYKLGYKLVWTAHNLLPHDDRQRELHFSAREFLIDRLSYIIVHSEDAVPCLRNTFTNLPPISVVPHGNFIGLYPPPPSKEHACKSLDLNYKMPVALVFGATRRNSGLQRLIEWAQSDVDNFQIIVAGRIVGSVDASSISEQLLTATNILHISQHVEDEMVSNLFGASDFVIYPRENVLTSGVVVLSQSMGRAIVAPQIGGLPAMIPPGTGVLFNPDNPDGLAHAISQGSALGFGKLGENARKYAEGLSWEHSAAETLKLYQRCLP